MADIQRLVGNLIAMHELLRDASRVTLRLVMTPDRMVVAEAMRTFTYLNLYGYLCDAVVVNRVFPENVGEYFGAWRAVQAEQLAEVEAGFAPVPVLQAAYFEQEVLGAAMLDRLAADLFNDRDAGAVLHDRLTQELSLNGSSAELRLDLPFVSRGDIALKKIGLELVVRVDGYKRRSCCRARWRASSRRRRSSRTARSSWGSRMAEPDPYAEAERLMRAAQAAAEAAAAAAVPPRGWSAPGEAHAAGI
jgi:arsenite-transporting ATPase